MLNNLWSCLFVCFNKTYINNSADNNSLCILDWRLLSCQLKYRWKSHRDFIISVSHVFVLTFPKGTYWFHEHFRTPPIDDLMLYESDEVTFRKFLSAHSSASLYIEKLNLSNLFKQSRSYLLLLAHLWLINTQILYKVQKNYIQFLCK